jgi:hypothetical protein
LELERLGAFCRRCRWNLACCFQIPPESRSEVWIPVWPWGRSLDHTELCSKTRRLPFRFPAFKAKPSAIHARQAAQWRSESMVAIAGSQWQARLLYKMTRRKDGNLLGHVKSKGAVQSITVQYRCDACPAARSRTFPVSSLTRTQLHL